MIDAKEISVIAVFNQTGNVKPLSIVWDDGRQFPIDEIMDVRKAASHKNGIIGLRYRCRIRNRVIHLYRDEDKWIMEMTN